MLCNRTFTASHAGGTNGIVNHCMTVHNSAAFETSKKHVTSKGLCLW
jgi:hypothetical protein